MEDIMNEQENEHSHNCEDSHDEHEHNGCCRHHKSSEEHDHNGCCHHHDGSEEHNRNGCCHHHNHSEDHGAVHHNHAHNASHHTMKQTSPCTVFVMKNIDCANCSAKIEKKIQELPEVDDCILTFATRQLRVYSKEGTRLLPKMQEIADAIEPGTVIEVRPKNPNSICTVFVMKNIDCANCSAKIEKKIQELPEVDDCILTFATRQLRVYSSEGAGLLPKMQEIADAIEPGTVIEVREEGKKQTAVSSDKHEKDLLELLAGGALFLAGEVISSLLPEASLLCFVLSYLILGHEVLLTALKNMKSGHVMDENFLMSVATIGAFAIGEFGEAVGVMLFYRIGEAFEHKAVEKSRSQIMDAVDLRPETVRILDGGLIREIPADAASVGDILEIRPGDRIPLDGTVLEGESRIDTSPITGEPVPVSVGIGSSVVSGCVNTSGLLKIKVEKSLSESMVTRILDSVENAAANKPQAERFITKFSRIYTPFVVALAAATAILPSLITGNWSHWIYTALTFLVISCPCALVLSVPLAFFSGIGAGSRQGILFKGGLSLEALKNVKTVVMDKTGTITKGNFVVQSLYPVNHFHKDELLRIAAACELSSTHPIGISIVTAAREKSLSIETASKIEEISGKGIHAQLSCGQVLCGNRKLLDEFGVNSQMIDTVGISEVEGCTHVYVAVNRVFAGMIRISDTVKPEAKEAISALSSMGLQTAMLTGDNEVSANVIANEVGIRKVYAKLLPADKLDILKKLRIESGNTMFVGDGINDAPVLAGADVGAAMGSGADAAIEAADVVFMTSRLDAIPSAIRIARSTGAVSNQNVIFALTIKALVMVLGLLGIASMWLAVFADTGVAILCVLNSIRILYKK